MNFPINNLEQSFTQEQKLQTRSNIGIPSSEDEEGKVLMVDNDAGELIWAEAPNGLPDIASGDEGKFLSVENGDPAWADVDIPEQVNADWDATSGVQEILNKPQMKPLVAGSNITITEGASQFTISSTSDPQVNADWDATSGIAEILHKPNLSTVAITGQYADLLGKPDIPASTSELINDSDFITASEAPVQDVKVDGSSVVDGNGIANISIPQFQQLNSDWDATSGVQEILNRPDVKPLVAGSNITITETPSSVEIAGVASAQQNADWDAVSGVSEILNKPDLSIYAETSDLATVATTGSYNDLVDRPSIPSAQINADWDATSGVSEILNKPNLATVATTGDYSDLQNLPSIPAAQINSDWSATSGISEILNKPTVKQVVAGANITITETANSFEISSTGGGGGSQVNADWDATSGVSEILNKPTPKTLTAGANISISEGVGTITISAAAGLPASTSADEGKCLVVDSNGDPEWGTGGKTYTGTDGVVVDNVNDTVGLEAPVDLVAGPGIAIDNPDGNTVRISVNQPARETVLYYSDAGAPGDTQRTYALSETPMNFKRIGIFMFRPVSGNWMGYTEFDTAYMQSVNKTSLTVPIAFINNSDHFLGVYGVSGILTSSWADVQGGQMVIGSSYSKGYFAHIYKIIGINRIANN